MTAAHAKPVTHPWVSTAGDLVASLTVATDMLRRFLLRILPKQEGDGWRAVACGVGDVAEEFFSLLAIAGIVLIAAVIGIVLAWLSLLLLLAVATVGLMVFAGWRLRVRLRRLEEVADRVLSERES